MKGALVQFSSTFAVSTPNVIIFQFNPETIRHSFTQTPPPHGAHPLAAGGNPGETFSFTLVMDATDQLAEENVIVMESGIYARLAALEILLFPVSSASGFIPSAGAAEHREVPAAQLPAVLFVWGPGRIVPVRLTSLVVTEKLFDPKLLHPTHAEAQIEMRVLTPSEIEAINGPLKQLAIGAYNYTHGKRMVLALVNLANASAALELPPIPGL